eukprot:TRINITY_DN10145_c0_g1_i1.p1 TRINITY_DN10145_c0_g1~~TRINITY_DN10145_c0_g1_i1.p1  ORF type:complete len:336 (+),score=77.80 TRINITY_DN10145_c0_g1_i1:40-1047(+)
MGTAAAAAAAFEHAIEMETTIFIHATTYWLKLRLPRAVLEQAPLREIIDAVENKFLCCRLSSAAPVPAVVPHGRPLPGEDAVLCRACHCKPVTLKAIVGDSICQTGTFLFTVTPQCTSTRAHFNSDLFLIFPEIPGCPCLVSETFKILSRNCKYRAKHKKRLAALNTAKAEAAIEDAELLPPTPSQHLTSRAALAVTVMPADSVVEKAPAAPALILSRPRECRLIEPKRRQFCEPVTVESSLLAAVLPRVIIKPTIIVSIIESDCFNEFFTTMLARHPTRMKIPPVAAHLNSNLHAIIATVDKDEFPYLYSNSMLVKQSPYFREARVRVLSTIVF